MRTFRLLLLLLAPLRVCANDTTRVSEPVVSFHIFYNDFGTAKQLGTRSATQLHFQNISHMQLGAGLTMTKPILRQTNLVVATEFSPTNYLFESGTMQGSSKLLIESILGIQTDLLPSRWPAVPYLSAGIGASVYPGNKGFFFPAGAGVRFRLFSEAVISFQLDARQALSAQVTSHFHYAVGVGTPINRRKKQDVPVIPPPEVPLVVRTEPAVPPAEKKVRIAVTDDETGLPLPGVVVTLTGNGDTRTATTDSSGTAAFDPVAANEYRVSGGLNGISTPVQIVTKNEFDRPENSMTVRLTHHDPRFTLTGQVLNKTFSRPEPGTVVIIERMGTNHTDTIITGANGSFSLPVAAASDFRVAAKKAGYISSLGNLSTKGLNRSAVLYVALDLEVEEVLAGKAITLRNIYYDSGSTKIKAESSTDLQRLVRFMTDNPETRVEIASHTDSRGSRSANLALSMERAKGVIADLVGMGIAAQRLRSKGYGETRPVNGCTDGIPCTEEQYAVNRRTEFRVVD